MVDTATAVALAGFGSATSAVLLGDDRLPGAAGVVPVGGLGVELEIEVDGATGVVRVGVARGGDVAPPVADEDSGGSVANIR